jgi:hypothetical protein
MANAKLLRQIFTFFNFLSISIFYFNMSFFSLIRNSSWLSKSSSFSCMAPINSFNFYPVVRPSNTCLLPHCGVPMDEGCTQHLSSDPMINLNTTVFPFRSFLVCEESPQVGASHPYKVLITRSTRVREGKQHTQDSIRSTHTHTSQDLSSKHNTRSSQLERSSNH